MIGRLFLLDPYYLSEQSRISISKYTRLTLDSISLFPEALDAFDLDLRSLAQVQPGRQPGRQPISVLDYRVQGFLHQ